MSLGEIAGYADELRLRFATLCRTARLTAAEQIAVAAAFAGKTLKEAAEARAQRTGRSATVETERSTRKDAYRKLYGAMGLEAGDGSRSIVALLLGLDTVFATWEPVALPEDEAKAVARAERDAARAQKKADEARQHVEDVRNGVYRQPASLGLRMSFADYLEGVRRGESADAKRQQIVSAIVTELGLSPQPAADVIARAEVAVRLPENMGQSMMTIAEAALRVAVDESAVALPVQVEPVASPASQWPEPAAVQAVAAVVEPVAEPVLVQAPQEESSQVIAPQATLRTILADYPIFFTLKSRKGVTFRVDEANSFVDGQGIVWVATQSFDGEAWHGEAAVEHAQLFKRAVAAEDPEALPPAKPSNVERLKRAQAKMAKRGSASAEELPFAAAVKPVIHKKGAPAYEEGLAEQEAAEAVESVPRDLAEPDDAGHDESLEDEAADSIVGRSVREEDYVVELYEAQNREGQEIASDVRHLVKNAFEGAGDPPSYANVKAIVKAVDARDIIADMLIHDGIFDKKEAIQHVQAAYLDYAAQKHGISIAELRERSGLKPAGFLAGLRLVD